MAKREDGASESFVSRLLNPFRSNDRRRTEEEQNNVYYEKENALANTINELQILNGHTDIVRLLLKIDEVRVASASDDAKIIIWNQLTGERLLMLEGHTLPITCLLQLERHVLVSGSSDRTIKMWDLRSGECKRTLTVHQGSIKCLCPLPKNNFCSGANDRQLCVWNFDGELLGTIERQEEENLHCLTCISDNIVVTASNSSLLLVYNTETLSFHKLLAYHRESVHCLVRLSNQLFASASIDGTIVVWQTEALTPFNILHYPEKYKNTNTKTYIYSVHFLLPLSGRYLAAAIARGLSVFDVYTNECIMECTDAHESDINALITLYDGTRLLSCSSDSSIKIWDLPKIHQDAASTLSNQLSGLSGVVSPKRSRKKRRPQAAVPVGEMWGHGDAVYNMIPLTDTSFISCGGDACVILWKDGRVQSEIRNGYAVSSLRQHHYFAEYFQALEREAKTTNPQDANYLSLRKNYSDESISGDVSEYEDASDGNSMYDAYRTPLTRSLADATPDLFDEDVDDALADPLYMPSTITASGSWPNNNTIVGSDTEPSISRALSNLERDRPASAASVLITSPPLEGAPVVVGVSILKKTSSFIQVPEYIFAYAERLRREKKLSLPEIEQHLKEQDHSDSIVGIIIAELTRNELVNAATTDPPA